MPFSFVVRVGRGAQRTAARAVPTCRAQRRLKASPPLPLLRTDLVIRFQCGSRCRRGFKRLGGLLLPLLLLLAARARLRVVVTGGEPKVEMRGILDLGLVESKLLAEVPDLESRDRAGRWHRVVPTWSGLARQQRVALAW